MFRAMELIRNEGMSPWAAAKAAGIEDTTVYKSPLYLAFLNETIGPAKSEEAMERLQASCVWGGDRSDVSPQSVAKEMSIPVLLIYNAVAFQAKVIEMLTAGKLIDDVSNALSIPVGVIKKLPRYLEYLASKHVAAAFAMLDASEASGTPLMPQDVAKKLKISVNLIYRAPQFEARVGERLKAGRSLAEISDELGIGPRAIKQLSVYANSPRRRGRPRATKQADQGKPVELELAGETV
jgi:hypothetical protein